MNHFIFIVIASSFALSSLAYGESWGDWVQSQRVAGGYCTTADGQVFCEQGPVRTAGDCSWAFPRRGVMCRLVECKAIADHKQAFENLGFKVVGSDQGAGQNGVCNLYFTDPNFRR